MADPNFFKKIIFLTVLIFMFAIVFVAKANYNRVNYSVPAYMPPEGPCYGDCNACGTPCPPDPPIEFI